MTLAWLAARLQDFIDLHVEFPARRRWPALDELVLTVSPVLAGRADTPRPGLVAARELLPGRTELAELLSVRQHGPYLFLRYRMRRVPPRVEPDDAW